MEKRGRIKLVAGLLILAFLVRLGFLLAIKERGLIFADSREYDTIAGNLAAGSGYTLESGEPTAALTEDKIFETFIEPGTYVRAPLGVSSITKTP